MSVQHDLEPEEPAAAPLTVLSPMMMQQPSQSPRQLVFFYSPEQFEVFTYEWVRALDERYERIELHAGAGDHGVDVAAYLTPHGLEGEWHSYQCKHYGKPLEMSIALPEMLKVFISVVEGYYTMPSQYMFVAPQMGRNIVRTLAKPSTAKQAFLDYLDKPTNRAFTSLLPATQQAVRERAAETDFSRFKPGSMDDILDLHHKTRHWAVRFNQPLAPRPPVTPPPADLGPGERRYIEQLVDVYRERWGGAANSLERVTRHSRASEHLQRQREAFYSAESLRVFARESVPDGYFEAVRKDVYDIVVEVADRRYPLGWDRLQAVLEAAGQVRLTETVLISVVRPLDSKGVCHHLANDNRLTWCEEDAE